MGVIGAGYGLGISVGFAVVAIVVSALLLWATSKLFKPKDQRFKTAFVVALIVGIVNFALGYGFSLLGGVGSVFGAVVNFVITIIIGIALVKAKYHQTMGRTLLMWLVWFLLNLIAAAIIGAIFAVVFVGAAIAAGGAGALLG